MGSFVYDTVTADGLPIAVCGICETKAEAEICNALNRLRDTVFGSYRSAFTIDYRLGELIREILADYADSISFFGASVGIENAECPTGGVFGAVGEETESAEEGIKYEKGFMTGTRPGKIAFAAGTSDKRAAELFGRAESRQDYIELYEFLKKDGCEFIIITDGSGEDACGMAADRNGIVFLSETRYMACERKDYFGYKRIGIMGGTFDPIHNGHLIAAETVREQLGLDKVIFIPTGKTSYKTGRASESHRYRMACAATESNGYFCVSSIETAKKDIAYTVDTVAELKMLCDDDAELYFIIGADVLEDITGWKGFDRLSSMCAFAAVTRPGYNKSGFLAMGKLREYGADVRFVEAPSVDISSSNIRKAVREGRSVRYLLPESVEDFIRIHGLYRGKAEQGGIDSILKGLA